MEQGIAMPGGTVETPKMPSADLINYRFDNIEKIQQATNDKLDQLTTNFATKEELSTLATQLAADARDRKWWLRTIAAAAISALLLSLSTVIVYLVIGARP